MPWIDAHCHLADPGFAGDIDAIIARSRAAGVRRWLQGGVDPDDWDRQLDLVSRYGDDIWPAFGLHPWRANTGALARLEGLLDRARAFGELGLDFSAKHEATAEAQRRCLSVQLEMARSAKKPLVLHVVRAHAEMQETLRKHGPFPYGGLVHAFSGSFEIAKRYLDMGFLISVGEAMLRPGYRTLKQSLAAVSGEGLVVETDTSEPAKLLAIAEAVGAARGEPRDAVLDRSTKNLEALFERSGTGKV